jgi:hypothetical protein
MSKKNPLYKVGAALLSLFIPLTGIVTANASEPTPPLACSVQTQPVFQNINPTNQSSLLTRNVSETKLLASKGYTDNSSAFKASSRLVTGLVPVYRMAKGTDYLWVPKLNITGEYETAKKNGYVSKYVEFYASAEKLDCAIPVNRVKKDNAYRYTTFSDELATLTKSGWVNEGVKFYALPASETPATPTPSPAPTSPATPVPTPQPTEIPNTSSVASVAAPANLTAKTSTTAARVTWDTPAITGTLTKYTITATGESYSKTFASKANEVVFTGLMPETKYTFKVTADVSSNDGTQKATAFSETTATTLKAAVTVPPVVTPPVVTTPVEVPPVTTPPAADPANWVRWENIAQPGENLNTVLAKPELTGKILKLPAGVFEVSDFRDVSAAIRVPKNVKGLIGSGNDTIIRIKPYSSTFAWSVPSQTQGGTNQLHILRMNNGVEPQVFSDVWIQGTEQGHNYNGIMIGQSKPGTTLERVLVTGIPGNDGTPPGETHGIGWWQSLGGISKDLEVDGYRWIGDNFKDRVKGPKVGAAPIGWNSSDNAKAYNIYTHDSLRSMPTFWQSNNAETWNLQSINNDAGINHEESFGIVHHQPVIYGSRNHQHIGFMSQRGDGKLTIIGATVDGWMGVGKEPGPVAKGAKMLILTPTKYYGTEGGKIVTRPTVVLDDGVTPHPFTWANG